MTQLRRDLTANVTARVWSAALGLLAIPIYLRHMGAEAYGLVGLMVLLENISSLMDAGLGTTLNRELARRSSGAGDSADTNDMIVAGVAGVSEVAELADVSPVGPVGPVAPVARAAGNANHEDLDARRDVLKTLQAVHWTLALVCGAAVYVLAPYIASSWVKAETLDIATITRCLRWMSLSVAASVLFSFYQGGLFGVHRQVAVNVLLIAASTVRVGAAVLTVAKFSGGPVGFFAAQGLAYAAQVAASAWLLWASLPRRGAPARFQWVYLRQVGAFVAVVSANSLLSAAMTQADKVIFSKVLTLADFGYYSLASTAAGVLWAAILPLNAPFFPRFASLWERRATAAMSDLYHLASQLTTAIGAPVAVILCAFSFQLMDVWTRNADTAAHTGLLLALLATGTALNSLASIPSTMQTACGWPGLMTTYNAVMTAILIPAVWFVASRYGAVGAAATAMVSVSGYMFVVTPIMHTRLLPGEYGRWIRADILGPIAAALVVALIARVAMPSGMGRLAQIIYIGATGVVTAAATLASLNVLRPLALDFFKRRSVPTAA